MLNSLFCVLRGSVRGPEVPNAGPVKIHLWLFHTQELNKSLTKTLSSVMIALQRMRLVLTSKYLAVCLFSFHFNHPFFSNLCSLQVLKPPVCPSTFVYTTVVLFL